MAMETQQLPLPALHYAIARADLRLPPAAFGLGYDTSAGNPESDDDNTGDSRVAALCATPHFAAGVSPFCPETSPAAKTPAAAPAATLMMAASLESLCSEERKRVSPQQKKGTRRGTLNPEAKSVLKAWMFSPEHFAHPYPSEEEKEELASEAGIEVKQLSNWFTNARKRLWQPVLRQSGVEVKNFLSTGRGGPRGSKLEVPPALPNLMPPPSPLPSPRSRASSAGAFSEASSTSTASSPLKRAWSDMEASLPSSTPSADEAASAHVAQKRKKTSGAAVASARKKNAGRKAAPPPVMTKIADQLSQELRLALAERAAANLQAAPPKSAAATFQELEILAATSLIGLHQQHYQPVH